MNQPSAAPEGQNKLLWFLVVLGALFFFGVVSMARPARHSTECATGSETNANGRWNYCIDPGIMRPPGYLGGQFNENGQGWRVPVFPPPAWGHRYMPEPLPNFDFPIIDLAPILKVLLLLLAIPALPLLHGWLLGQAWRYMFPLDEADKALRLAWQVSAGLTVLAVPALVLWLTHVVTDLSLILGALAVIIVATGIAVGVRTARRREFTDAFTRKLGVVTGLLSLVVPAGAAITVLSSDGSALGTATWSIIVSLILGFILYRQTLTEYLDRFQAVATRWQIDHLAVEILALFLVVLVPTGLFAGYLASSFSSSDQFGWILMMALGGIWFFMLALPFVGIVGMWMLSVYVSVYVAWRGRGLAHKKKGSPLELHDTPLFDDNQWLKLLLRQTAVWLGGSIGVSVMLLITQNFLLR